MKKLLKYLFFLLFIFSFRAEAKDKKILVFSYTQKFRHKSIETGFIALEKLAQEKGFIAIHSENPADFTNKNLKKYKAIVFLSPTGDHIFNEEQKQAFQQYIKRGGAFLGIHAATDCNYEWTWYGKLVGAYFTNHPKIQEATLNVLDKNHPSTKDLPTTWLHTDEWYNFKDFNPDVKVLISVDESTYEGGKMPDFHPISWYHKFEGGKAFYTALGHTEECYSDKLFLAHLSGALTYVLNK